MTTQKNTSSEKPKKSANPTGKRRHSRRKDAATDPTIREWDVSATQEPKEAQLPTMEAPASTTVGPEVESKAESKAEPKKESKKKNKQAATEERATLWQRYRRHWVRYTAAIAAVLLIASGVYAYMIVSSAANSIIDSEDDTTIAQQLGMVFNRDNRPLQGEEEDRINVLLLGIGGEGHPGSNLTDSIMIASIEPSTNKVALFSLPRDLIVKIYDDENPNYWEGRKINNAYSIGGISLARDVIETVTGLDIHYYAVIDFTGFKQVIDDIGGITLDVETSFTGLYGANELSTPCPASQIVRLEDGAYCSIPFQTGEQNMNGERALIYSRIRKLAPGSRNLEQGNDFARAQRQQAVLEAFQQKTLSLGTLLKPQRITDLLHSVSDHVNTNVELWEMVKFAEMAAEIDTEAITSYVVDASESGLLYEPAGTYVLVPKAGEYNYSEIQAAARNIFAHAESVKESATAQVLNGSTRVGLAARTAEMLKTFDIDISDVGNAPSQNITTTKVYDLSKGTKSHTLELLVEQLDASVGSDEELQILLDQPDALEYFDTATDFIVILGSNQAE